MSRRQWRCFHCDAVFRSEQQARIHFGSDESATCACVLPHEQHLVEHIRDLEQQLDSYRVDNVPILKSIMTLEADHRHALIRVEEAGYSKGIRDARAMPQPRQTRIHYEEGEAPWSEDEQFDEQRKFCVARRKEYGNSHCDEKDGSCTECEDDAFRRLCKKYPATEAPAMAPADRLPGGGQ